MPQIRLTLDWGTRNDGTGDYAYARLRELGLTAYSEETEGALRRLLESSLTLFVRTHWAPRDLEEVLLRAGEEEDPS